MVLLSVHNSADRYGASQSLLRLLSMLRESGHEIHVVVPETGSLVGLLEEQGIHVHLYPGLTIVDRQQLRSVRGVLAFLWSFPRSVLWLARFIHRHHIEAVHTNVAVLPASGLAARLTGRRHFWHIREFFSEFRAFWALYQPYIGLVSTRIIANSEATRLQFTPRLQQKCSVVYNGLEPDAEWVDRARAEALRTEWGSPAFLIGVVGRIKFLRKGQEVLVRAAALLKERFPELRYAIVGSTAAGNEDHLLRLQELVREKGLEDRVRFTGDLTGMRDVYAAFDLTVVPSVLPEPFGCVVIESMAAGTPVIGSECGGIPEQIVDGVTGLLVTPGDEAALAEAIARLVEDERLRLRMADEGRRRFRERFVLQSTARVFAELLDENGAQVAQEA